MTSFTVAIFPKDCNQCYLFLNCEFVSSFHHSHSLYPIFLYQCELCHISLLKRSHFTLVMLTCSLSCPIYSCRLDEHVGVPYVVLALPVGLVIILALVLIEYLAPWQTELTAPNTSDVPTGLVDFISLRSWPPVLAGE